MHVALLSFRLGGLDGVSVVADAWRRIIEGAGHRVTTVAGAGPVDRTVPGLAWPTEAPPPTAGELGSALDGIDVVIVENLCSLPLNPGATEAVVAALRGRPAVLHHHDLPWQRARFLDVAGWPADDPAWRHVTVNRRTRDELATRGIEATAIYNPFDVNAPPGDGERCREAIGVAPGERLVLHPVRAIERKDVPAAVDLAEALGATYWLTGPAEEGYGPVLDEVLAAARCRVLHRPAPGSMADAYSAADAVAYPSRWEGFGNPLVEAALARRPVAVHPYPVAVELEGLGFRWFPSDDPRPLADFLEEPDEALLDGNHDLATVHFGFERIGARVLRVLDVVSG